MLNQSKIIRSMLSFATLIIRPFLLVRAVSSRMEVKVLTSLFFQLIAWICKYNLFIYVSFHGFILLIIQIFIALNYYMLQL